MGDEFDSDACVVCGKLTSLGCGDCHEGGALCPDCTCPRCKAVGVVNPDGSVTTFDGPAYGVYTPID